MSHNYSFQAKCFAVKGANAEIQSSKGMTSLMYASGSGHIDILKNLLSKGAKIEEKKG